MIRNQRTRHLLFHCELTSSHRSHDFAKESQFTQIKTGNAKGIKQKTKKREQGGIIE